MLRYFLSIIAGVASWWILWVTLRTTVSIYSPTIFNNDGSTDSMVVMILFVCCGFGISIVAGFVAAVITVDREKQMTWIVGVILLIIGIYVQLQVWDLLPLWYHIAFLILLIPGVLVGGRILDSQRLKTNPVSE